MSGKAKAEGLHPVSVVKLDTLANVRTEMARVYRLALKGKVDPSEMTKFIYGLKEIRCCIEGETLEDLQKRMVALSERLGANGQ